MTETGALTNTGTRRVMVRYSDRSKLTLDQSVQLFTGLRDYAYLIFLANPAISQDTRHFLDLGTMNAEDFVKARVEVERFSYESPPEILLAITSTGLATTLLANRFIIVFNNYQAARVRKAASKAEVVAIEAISAEVSRVFNEAKPLEHPEVTSRLATAAEALTLMQSIQFVPTDEP